MGQVPQRTGLRSLAAHWTRNVAKRIIAQADATTPTMFAEKEDNDIESMDIIDIEGEPPSQPQPVANDHDDDDVEMAFEDTSLSESSESEYSDSSSDEHIAQSRASTPEPDANANADADADPHEDQNELTPPPYQVPDSRPRFCCLPSPLSLPENKASESPSASSSSEYSQTAVDGDPPRHMYPNHGHSRPSLLFTRSFWANKRERDYKSASMEIALEGAQESETGAEPSVEAEPNHPTWTHRVPPICLTIYPRTGDIASLQHSWGKQVDMCFWTTPMHTIHKLLWMFAVHAGVAAREELNAMLMGEEANGGPIEDDELEEVTIESESTEASDRTLVEDASVDCSGWFKSEQDVMMEDAEGRGGEESLPLPSPPAPPRALPADSNKTTTSIYQPKWALSECARWQLLMDMVQHQQAGLMIPPPPMQMQMQMASATPTRRPPRFFLGDEDEEGWVDERTQLVDEEDEDYGELVVNPIFGGQQGFAV